MGNIFSCNETYVFIVIFTMCLMINEILHCVSEIRTCGDSVSLMSWTRRHRQINDEVLLDNTYEDQLT